MNTEIIIAVRGELPQNLARTVQQAREAAPVCVVFDGDETGNETPPGLEKLARIVRLRGVPRGPGGARHEGIVTSKADLIVICDGHMSFPAGWLDTIRKWHAHPHHKKHLTCCRMQSLDQRGNVLNDAQGKPTRVEGGAWISRASKEVCAVYWALSVKWLGEPLESGPCPAVIGACYALRREWYDKIGQPLRMLQAWGGDEEILSLGTHLMGGSVRLLPVTIGHIYFAAHRGRVQTADESARIWGNRFAMLDAMPMPDEERRELSAWMRQTKRVTSEVFAKNDVAAELRELYSDGERSWDDLKAQGIVRQPTPAEQSVFLGRIQPQPLDTSTQVKPQVVIRPAEVCRMCGAVNSFRKLGGDRRFLNFDQAYARCARCGHKAVIRVPA